MICLCIVINVRRYARSQCEVNCHECLVDYLQDKAYTTIAQKGANFKVACRYKWDKYMLRSRKHRFRLCICVYWSDLSKWAQCIAAHKIARQPSEVEWSSTRCNFDARDVACHLVSTLILHSERVCLLYRKNICRAFRSYLVAISSWGNISYTATALVYCPDLFLPKISPTSPR